MLIHVGDDRTVAIDMRLAVSLAAVAGAINAAGFRSLGYFSANMTGNVSVLSDELAQGLPRLAFWLLCLVGFYIFGAFTSAILIEYGRQKQIRGIYAYSILLEAGLLAFLAAIELIFPHPVTGSIMVLSLSFIMGLQNAATTRISGARVRTTHVSGTATDIGIELAVLLAGARDNDRRSVVFSRFKLHAATIIAFLLGGIAGAFAYGIAGAWVFLAVAAILFMIAAPEARRSYVFGRQMNLDSHTNNS
ncbi:YoaK family protein [Martelella sp. HB161492]|uniref:YoaK family protein n=1 Tax=Martelella sp. HB161492 TaxID=2720726 RepID=UPI0015901179|nr:YoaK family protein [Martelella sp. HB161492]